MGVTLLVMLGSRSVAAFPSSRLVYSRGPGAESCPDRDAVRDAVKRRLGYDPFFPSSDKTIVARISRDADRLRGEVELVGEQGTRLGHREVFAPADQCDELVRVMALSISIAIDPKSAETYEQGPPDEPAANPAEKPADLAEKPDPASVAPTEDRAAQPPPPALPPRAEALPWLGSVGLGPTAQLGTLPHLALGAAAFAALRHGAWSLALEGELDLPSTTREQGVELRSSNAELRAVPCGHWRLAFACQVTSLRWMSATGSASNQSGSARSLSLGARVGMELPLASRLGLLGYADLLFGTAPVRLRSEGREVWRAPLVSSAVGLAAVLNFP